MTGQYERHDLLTSSRPGGRVVPGHRAYTCFPIAFRMASTVLRADVQRRVRRSRCSPPPTPTLLPPDSGWHRATIGQDTQGTLVGEASGRAHSATADLRRRTRVAAHTSPSSAATGRRLHPAGHAAWDVLVPPATDACLGRAVAGGFARKSGCRATWGIAGRMYVPVLVEVRGGDCEPRRR